VPPSQCKDERSLALFFGAMDVYEGAKKAVSAMIVKFLKFVAKFFILRPAACCACGGGALALEAKCLFLFGPGKPYPTFRLCLCDNLTNNKRWETVCDICFFPLTHKVKAQEIFGC
jgi:hypothetical protein